MPEIYLCRRFRRVISIRPSSILLLLHMDHGFKNTIGGSRNVQRVGGGGALCVGYMTVSDG